jgi:pimeloyl-ACP methyl ester carboxylesterase
VHRLMHRDWGWRHPDPGNVVAFDGLDAHVARWRLMADAPSLPTLVLLPGLDGTGKLFTEFVKVLGSRVSTIVVSYPLDQPLGYDELERLVLSALPQHRPIVVLGESFSGPIAIRIAARGLANFRGLILCGTFAKNPFPWAGWARGLASHLPVKSLPRWVRAPLMWGSASPGRAPTQMERAMSGVSASVIRYRIAALLSVDERPSLRQVHAPILVLRARRDRVISKAATRWITKTVTSAQLVEVDGPHLLLQTRPEESASAIVTFMSTL